MKTINAEIVADSICNGHRITTMLLTYPRFVHSELMTHRVFSRNSASSRAIPFEKMVKAVEEDPFIPIAWQKDHKGMQGTEYFTDPNEIRMLEIDWYNGMYNAVQFAHSIHNKGLTKQLCNRLLEPFMWHTALITATDFENFFELRCPQYRSYDGDSKVLFRSKKDFLKFKGCPNDSSDILYFLKHNESQAEIHIQALAEAMWDAQNESTPKELEAGEWHIPFGDKMDSESIAKDIGFKTIDYDWYNKELWTKIKISSARCARLSYMTFDGEIDYKKDIKLHDQLLKARHYSPFEHCARAMDELEYEALVKTKSGYMTYEWDHGWCNNFRGWIQYRYLIENSN